MCGIAGFFTGCSFKGQCAGSSAPACKMRFSSSKVFEDWHDKASVRKRPRRILEADDQGLDLFPRHLVPVVSHQLINERYMEQVSHFLCLQLHRYLNFTVNLELLVVNPSVLEILKHAEDFQLSAAEVMALHKIYVDEGYHALFSQDMAQQVHNITGVAPEFHMPPSFISLLAQMQSEVEDPLLVKLLFTAVSETLITGSLRDVARKGASPSAVSDLMRDHAADEGRHHAFFKDILCRIQSLDPMGLRRALPIIPRAIFAFIDPDRAQLLAGLVQAGVIGADAEQIIEETYPEHLVRASAKESARDLLEHIEQMEIGQGTGLSDELHRLGLVH